MQYRNLNEKNGFDELLKLVDMEKWKHTQISKFSTGMKQRINVIRALLPEPQILFMDEPTLGLDPQTTVSIREIIRDINDGGVTVILTTHAMVEAEALSDRIAIIDHGKIAALDTPQNLKNTLANSDTTIFTTKIVNLSTDMIDKIRSLDVVSALSQQDDQNLKISAQGDDSLNQIIDAIRLEGGEIFSIINSNESTLEDVFLSVTGKEIRDQPNERAVTQQHGHGPRPQARVR